MTVGDIGIWEGTANIIPGTTFSKMTFGGTEIRNDNSTFTRISGSQDFQVNEDGAYLIIGVVAHNNTSNGRANYVGKITYSGSGDFATVHGSGYVRDSSNDDATVTCYGFIRNATSGDTVSLEQLRGSNAPTGGTVAAQTHLTIIRWEDSLAVGLYNNSSDSGAYSTTSWQDLVFDTNIAQTDQYSIRRVFNDFTLRKENTRYLVIGGTSFTGSSGTRTQRVIRAVDGGTEINGVFGYAYIRDTSNPYGSPNCAFIIERTTTNIDLSFQAQRGNAEQSGSVTRNIDDAGVIILELPTETEVFASYDNIGGQSINDNGPTNINITRTTAFNDVESFIAVPDNVTYEVNKFTDVFTFANIGVDAGSTTSSTRLTRKFQFAINGVAQERGSCIGYLSNDQSSSGTRSGSWHPSGVYSVPAKGVTVQYVNDGWDNGTPDDITDAGRIGVFAINLQTLGTVVPDTISVDTAPITLTPNDVSIKDNTPTQVDTSSLSLTSFDLMIIEDGNKIYNGSFEEHGTDILQDNGTWALYASLPAWEVDRAASNAPIELQFGTTGGIAAHDGNTKVEIDSSAVGDYTSSKTHLYQIVPTNLNEAYELSVWYSPRNASTTNTVEVWWDGTQIDTLSGTVVGWVNYTYNVNGSSSVPYTRLEFRASDAANSDGGYIDSISLKIASTPTIIDVDTVALSLTNLDVNIKEDDTTQIELETLTFTPNDVIVNESKSVTIDTGSLDLVSQNVTLLQGTEITINPLYLTLTSEETNLNSGTTLQVDNSDLSLASLDINLNEVLLVNTSELSLTPYDVQINEEDALNIDKASLYVTPFDVNLNSEDIVFVDTTSISLTSLDSTILEEDILLVDTVNLTFTPNDITLNSEDVLVVDTASLILTSYDVLINEGTSAQIDTAQLELTPQTININQGQIITIDPSILSLTSNETGIQENTNILMDSASLSLVPSNITINDRDIVEIDVASLTLTPRDVLIAEGSEVIVQTAELSLNSLDLIVNERDVVVMDGTSLVLSPFDIKTNETVQVETSYLTISAEDIKLNETVKIDTSSLELNSLDINIRQNNVISVTEAPLALSWYPPTIEASDTLPVDTSALSIDSLNVDLVETVHVDTSTLYITSNTVTIGSDIVMTIEPIEMKLFTNEIDINSTDAIFVETANLTITPETTTINESVSVDNASLTLSPLDITLNSGQVIPINTGSLSLSPEEVNLKSDDIEFVETSSLEFYPQTINIPEAVYVDTSPLLFTSLDITLNSGQVLPIDNASLTISSEEVNLKSDDIEFVETSSLEFNPQTINIPEAVKIETANLTVTSLEVNLSSGQVLPIDSASLALSPEEVTLKSDDIVFVETSSLDIETYQINIPEAVKIETASLELTSYDVTFTLDTIIQVDTGVLSLETYPVNISDLVKVETASLSITSYEVAFNQIQGSGGFKLINDQNPADGYSIDDFMNKWRDEIKSQYVDLKEPLFANTVCKKTNIKASEIHSYPILIMSEANIEEATLGVQEFNTGINQDFGLQIWFSDEPAENGSDRSKLTTRDSSKKFKLYNPNEFGGMNIARIKTYDQTLPAKRYQVIFVNVMNAKGKAMDYNLCFNLDDYTIPQLIKYDAITFK